MLALCTVLPSMLRSLPYACVEEGKERSLEEEKEGRRNGFSEWCIVIKTKITESQTACAFHFNDVQINSLTADVCLCSAVIVVKVFIYFFLNWSHMSILFLKLKCDFFSYLGVNSVEKDHGRGQGHKPTINYRQKRYECSYLTVTGEKIWLLTNEGRQEHVINDRKALNSTRKGITWRTKKIKKCLDIIR